MTRVRSFLTVLTFPFGAPLVLSAFCIVIISLLSSCRSAGSLDASVSPTYIVHSTFALSPWSLSPTPYLFTHTLVLLIMILPRTLYPNASHTVVTTGTVLPTTC